MPQFGQKQDAVPGAINRLVITPNRLGTYPVVCTELCGLGHALMRSEAVVMSRHRLRRLVQERRASRRRRAAAAAAPIAAARAMFNVERLRGLPHVQGDPGRDREDRSRPRRSEARPRSAPASRSTQFIHDSIVDPNAYIAPGYQPGVMPPNFGTTIPADKLDQLVQYLLEHTH